jgi:hypothetical protein
MSLLRPSRSISAYLVPKLGMCALVANTMERCFFCHGGKTGPMALVRWLDQSGKLLMMTCDG